VSRTIPLDEVAGEWMKDPEFVAAYDALDEEFTLAAALIRARGTMTQEQLASAMGTTQAVIARLESGTVKPSTRTLERLANATHTRLRISFEPTVRKSPTAVRHPRHATTKTSKKATQTA
jgi:transcriptional regulator with XRE-family HTH domain